VRNASVTIRVQERRQKLALLAPKLVEVENVPLKAIHAVVEVAILLLQALSEVASDEGLS
jgi:hypothetical protein